MAKVNWLTGKTVVVTGASSGIGREITKILIEKHSCKVIGTGRDEAKLKQLQSELKGLSNLFSYKTFDISSKARFEEFAKELKFTDTQVDVLINNAGVLPSFKKATDIDISTVENVMNINFYGAVYGTRAMWDVLEKSNTPAIINITSSAALCALAGTSVYSASKAALKSYTEAMQHEYKNMYISFVCPGLTKSAIFRSQENSTKDKRINMLAMDATKMANKIVKGMTKRKKRMVIGMDACFMDSFYRFCPNLSKKLINWFLKTAKIDLYKDVYK